MKNVFENCSRGEFFILKHDHTYAIMTAAINNCISQKGSHDMEVLEIPEKEMVQKNIEEFVQLQSYMLLADKDSEVYTAMKVRYNTLKVILTSSGINLTDIDRIKECKTHAVIMSVVIKLMQHFLITPWAKW